MLRATVEARIWLLEFNLSNMCMVQDGAVAVCTKRGELKAYKEVLKLLKEHNINE